MNKLLLVDDETELTEPLGRALRREGYRVDVAMDGETALTAIATAHQSQDPYELVILDWMLPCCSGMEVCQRMRQDSDSTPVLFLTAKDTLDDRVQGLDVGADDYLVKPFELRELLARVRALIRRQSVLQREIQSEEFSLEASSVRLQVDGLELDRDNQVAYRHGRAISLSDKESQLLAYLMQHPKVILTHDQIYDHLWPKEDKPGSNVLAAQMRLLRRKIETRQEPSLIRTIYGKGYRFGADA